MEIEWECNLCGCVDIDETDETFDGYVIYKCPDCNNKQTKEYLLHQICSKLTLLETSIREVLS